MQKKIKNNLNYLFSPFIVLCILMFVYYKSGLFPFGTNALNWGDMAQQNFPVMVELKDVLQGNNGPFFSMVNAGGMDFSGMFLFLGSSPFSILAIFFSKANLIYYINIMILLKLMTASVTASIFFKRFFKNLSILQNTALSISYALCGYSMLFYQLHTWLDVMYTFPLLLISFDLLIRKKKFAPYCITLSFMIFFQFYLGYMIALFLIFGFFVYILITADKDKKKQEIVYFVTGSIIAVLLSCPVLLTALVQYKNSARGVDVITSLISGNFITSLPTTLAFLLVTSMLFISLPFAFRLKMFKNKKELALIIVYILLLIPVFIEPINKMWHTGSYQAFPVRYGYITVLMGLTLMAAVISKINNTHAITNVSHKISIMIATLICIEFYFIVRWYLQTNGNILKKYSTNLWGSPTSLKKLIIYSIISCAILVFFIIQFKIKKISKATFSVLLCGFVIVEGFFNSSVYVGYGARTTDKYKQTIDLADKINDDDEYRVKVFNKYFDVNLVGAMGYNSLSHYTSLIDSDYIFAMKKLGYSSYWMEVNSNGSTAFTDALLGNKYTIYNHFDSRMSKNDIYSNNMYHILKNNNCLSLGNVITSEQAEKLKNIPDTNRINFQNTLYKTLTDSKENLLSKYYFTTYSNVNIFEEDNEIRYLRATNRMGNFTYNIFVNGKQQLYFDCFKDLTTNLVEPINSSFNIIVNNIVVEKDYPSKYNNGMLFLGEFENEPVEIKVNVQKSGSANSFGLYGLDVDMMQKGLSLIRNADIDINGDTITANAYAGNDDDMLLLTIPENKGFTITVNDKLVESTTILDAFMAIPLEKGDNVVKLRYMSYGLKYGLIIGFTGILLLILLSVLTSRNKHIINSKIESILYWAFIGGCTIIFTLIYIIPVIIYIIGQILFR